MATHNVQLGLNTDRTSGKVQFLLDDEKYTQKMMLQSFKAQQLFEPKLSQLLIRYLKPGDVFVDIGGHIGYYSMLASTLVGPSGKVVTFEPEASNYQHILRHIELNRCANVMPFPWAANATSGPVTLFVCPGNDGGHAIWDLRRGPYEANTPTLPQQITYSVAIDEIRPIIATPRIIKIDVEGAEMEVLKGARKLLAEKSVSFVVCECHRPYLACMGQSEQSLRDHMTNLGYEVYSDFGAEPGLIALPPGATLNTNYIFNLIFALPGALAA